MIKKKETTKFIILLILFFNLTVNCFCYFCNDFVYYKNNKVSSASTPTQFVDNGNAGRVWHIQGYGGYIYWSNNEGNIKKIPENGGSISTIYTASAGILDFAILNDYIYFMDVGDSGKFKKVSINGGSTTTITTLTTYHNILDILSVSGTDYAYIACRGHSGTVVRVTLSTSATTTIDTLSNECWALACHPYWNYIIYNDNCGSGGKIIRTSWDGSGRTELVSTYGTAQEYYTGINQQLYFVTASTKEVKHINANGGTLYTDCTIDTHYLATSSVYFFFKILSTQTIKKTYSDISMVYTTVCTTPGGTNPDTFLTCYNSNLYWYEASLGIYKHCDHDDEAPAAPGNPYWTDGSLSFDTSITADWNDATDPSGINDYYLQVATSSDFLSGIVFNGLIGSTASTKTLTNANGISNGNTYYFRVAAKDTVGNVGAYTTTIPSIKVDTQQPDIPTNLHWDNGGISGSTTITADWDDVIDFSGVNDYNVQVATSSDFQSGVIYDSWIGGNSSSLTLTSVNGVSTGYSYYFRVKAKDNAGWIGSFSSASTEIKIDTQIPSAPVNLHWDDAPISTDSNIIADWDDVNDFTGIIDYFLQVANSSDFLSGVIFNDWIESSSSTYTITQANGVLHANTYYFRVFAKDGAGNMGMYSSTSPGIMVDTQAPNSPLNPHWDDGVWSNDTNIIADWTDAFDPSGITDYLLQVDLDSKDFISDMVFNGYISSSQSMFSLSQIDGITNEHQYSFRVAAKDGTGQTGPFSASSEYITIDTNDPPCPTIINWQDGNISTDLKISANWDDVSDFSGIVDYFLQVDVDSFDFSTGLIYNDFIHSPLSNFTLTEEDGVMNGHRYYYRVRSKDRAGHLSVYSNISLGVIVDSQMPLAPQNIHWDEGYATHNLLISADWDDIIDPSGVRAYHLQVDVDSTDFAIGMIFDNWIGIDSNYSLSQNHGIISGHTYYFRVAAKDGADFIGTYSVISAGIIVDTQAPPAPLSIRWLDRKKSYDTTLIADWADVIDLSGIMDYYIQLAEDSPDLSSNLIFNSYCGSNVSTKMWNKADGIKSGHTYYIRIAAQDYAGNLGAYSEIFSVIVDKEDYLQEFLEAGLLMPVISAIGGVIFTILLKNPIVRKYEAWKKNR
jgi:hypothetical protein